HGNYLRGSIEAQGLDPENLPESDATKMDFSAGASKPKAWKDIWGCGQGIAAVDAVLPAAEMVARLGREYEAARARLGLAPASSAAAE
ncbi:MAG: nitronate monooxygenase, partial [Paracoccaceae bacterium]